MTSHELCMSVTKIFNWTSNIHKNIFILSFYSTQTNELIIQKQVQGVLTANTMHLNCLLKIAYTSDQKQIVLKIASLDTKIGQFKLNLQTLKDKKVQYFPFGQQDKVLQINLTSEHNLPKEADSFKQHQDKYLQFLKKREDFLSNVLTTHQNLKRNYSQNIHRVLNREMYQANNYVSGSNDHLLYKNDKPTYSRLMNQNNDYELEKGYEKQKKTFQRQGPISENKILRPNKSRSQQAHIVNNQHTNNHKIRQKQSSKQGKSSTSSKNNKLMLNTLNIVPSEEYFQHTNRVNQQQEINKRNINYYESKSGKINSERHYPKSTQHTKGIPTPILNQYQWKYMPK